MMTVPNFYRLETSSFDLSKYNPFIQTPLDNSRGRLKLAKAPGLGVEMDLDFLRGNIVDGFGDPG
jgi:galactonate dehydratase